MKILGNNDGDLGKKSKRQQKKDKEARAARTGVSTEKVNRHMSRVNSGAFNSNDHGLPDGLHQTKKTTATAVSTEPLPKFRKKRHAGPSNQL